METPWTETDVHRYVQLNQGGHAPTTLALCLQPQQYQFFPYPTILIHILSFCWLLYLLDWDWVMQTLSFLFPRTLSLLIVQLHSTFTILHINLWSFTMSLFRTITWTFRSSLLLLDSWSLVVLPSPFPWIYQSAYLWSPILQPFMFLQKLLKCTLAIFLELLWRFISSWLPLFVSSSSKK